MSEYRGTERTGLYIMVVVTLLNSCDTKDAVTRIEKNYCKVPVVEFVTIKPVDNNKEVE